MKYFLILTLIISYPICLNSQVSPTNPGVYIEEIKPIQTITPVSTTITAFIGCTEKNISQKNAPILITSFAEYQTQFGNAPSPKLKLASDDPNDVKLIFSIKTRYFLYDAVRLFFKNGGETCYISSIGNYTSGVQKEAMIEGIGLLKDIADISQVTIPDAVLLPREARAEVQQKMLLHAKKYNRFAILDILKKSDLTLSIDNFRADIPNKNLQYGAVYYPWLTTSVSEDIDPKDYIIGWDELAVEPNSDFYKKIKKVLIKRLEECPPSGAIAGIYAKTDNGIGVWKAPANVSVLGITGFTQSISDTEQSYMNISVTDGKSVNALRSFINDRHLVWGARTLAGFDQQSRYISVHRLNAMIELSIDGYLKTLAFEDNTLVTWNLAKKSISNFLNNLWRQGALAGASSNYAYNVKVGLGETMTQKDLGDGKMVVEIHIAPIRPAEFFVLKFETKMAN